jgi:hypothetical protein
MLCHVAKMREAGVRIRGNVPYLLREINHQCGPGHHDQYAPQGLRRTANTTPRRGLRPGTDPPRSSLSERARRSLQSPARSASQTRWTPASSSTWPPPGASSGEGSLSRNGHEGACRGRARHSSNAGQTAYRMDRRWSQEHLTQDDLAAATGIGQSEVSRIEPRTQVSHASQYVPGMAGGWVRLPRLVGIRPPAWQAAHSARVTLSVVDDRLSAPPASHPAPSLCR